MNMLDWRAAAVAAPAWSVEDTTRTPFGYCARGGGFRMMSIAEEYKDIDSVYWHGVMGSVENEWYGTARKQTSTAPSR